MELSLLPHPDHQSNAEISLKVLVERTTSSLLQLRYEVVGEVGKILAPPIGFGVRADELWKTTCFEAFIMTEEASGYCELNFSPSLNWAAYQFDEYRSGMRDAPLSVIVRPGPDHRYAAAMLHAEVDFSATPLFEHARIWALGLTAVVETTDRTKSYWALAHAPGKPDFHNADCFVARLAAPDGA